MNFLKNTTCNRLFLAVLVSLLSVVGRESVAISDVPIAPKRAVAAGTELIGNGDKLAQAAKWIKPQNGVYDVVVHGSSDAFHVLHNGKWVQVNHRSLATLIRKDGWAGEPIRLISCSSGACPTGVAQNLANKLGAKISAPSDTLWIHPNGNLTIGSSPLSNTGIWNIFTPGGNLP